MRLDTASDLIHTPSPAPIAGARGYKLPTRRRPLSAVLQRLADDRYPLTRADVLQLQRSLGNAAVGRILSQAAPVTNSAGLPGGLKPEIDGSPLSAALRRNHTGLPDRLKSGVEGLSGLAMDDVRVHYNSAKPAEVHALAFTQGSHIHLASGQQRHLPHEAWHVVQQKQGRVKPTWQLKDIAINDDDRLEREADIMGCACQQDLPAQHGSSEADRHGGQQGKPFEVVQLRAANLGANYQRTEVALPVYFKANEYAFDNSYERDLGHFAGVPAFVRAAAAEAGHVGSMAEIASATRNTNNANAAAAGSEKWIISSEDLGARNKPHSIEPFNISLEGQYSLANTPVSITYHFGNFNNGYIMAQSEDGTAAAIEGYGGAADNAVEYSNVHVNTDEVADEDMNARMTGDLTQGEAWDARTILGGEGARFEPVRDLQEHGKLTNSSRFFTGMDAAALPAQDDDLVASIRLYDLWGIWTRRFPGQFDVNSAGIAVVLRRFSRESSDRVEILEYQDMASETDFDLDRDAVKP